jgi:hypothetical protein
MSAVRNIGLASPPGAPVDAPHPDSAGELSYQAAHFNSPLQAAAKGGYVEIVELLLKYKPVVDRS